jgi:hypothetical protein
MAIYMATHLPYSKPPFDYIIPIFVGNSPEREKFAGITDRTGVNISPRNHIYGELTALYWIWKNTQDEVVGLCHYRRFFDISRPEIQSTLHDNRIIVPPVSRLKWQVDKQFVHAHNEQIWRQTLDILYRKHPHYKPLAAKVFSNNLLYRHNMFIAGRVFVEEYCSFVFDILFELEKFVELHHLNDYQQRYAGFVSERLLTLYILGNDTPRIERRIINDSRQDVSQEKWRRILNNLYFRVLGK